MQQGKFGELIDIVLKRYGKSVHLDFYSQGVIASNYDKEAELYDSSDGCDIVSVKVAGSTKQTERIDFDPDYFGEIFTLGSSTSM